MEIIVPLGDNTGHQENIVVPGYCSTTRRFPRDQKEIVVPLGDNLGTKERL